MNVEDASVPCVVVAAGGCWGNILSFLRSLGARGIPVHLVGVGCDLSVAKVSRYCAGFVRIPSGEGAEVARDLLAWRWRMGWVRHPVLFFVSERLGGMFCSQRFVLEEGFVLPLPDADVLDSLLRKDCALELARGAGLTVPESWTVLSSAGLEEACADAMLPAVIKPLGADTLGLVSYKASVVLERGELQRLAHVYWAGGSRFVIQQYIPGEDATLWAYLFYRCRRTGELHEWTGRKLRQSPPGAGIMALGVAQLAPHVAEAGRRFVEASGYWGMGGVEFKECEGALYFIEMNPRAEAIQSMAIADGVDLVALAYADAIGLALPAPATQESRSSSHYVDGEAYLGSMWNGKERIGQAKELFRHALQRNIVFPIWRIDDPCPFILSMWVLFLKGCRRVFSRRLIGMRGTQEIK